MRHVGKADNNTSILQETLNFRETKILLPGNDGTRLNALCISLLPPYVVPCASFLPPNLCLLSVMLTHSISQCNARLELQYAVMDMHLAHPFLPRADTKGLALVVLGECLMHKCLTSNAGVMPNQLRDTEGMFQGHSTLTHRGWRCPLSQLSTLD